MRTLRSGRTSRSVLAGSTAMLLGMAAAGGVAYAQNADESGQGAGGTVQEVVVTGSRIARRDFTATSPIVTVNTQNFETKGAATLETTLNQMPQFTAGALNSVTGAAQVQPTAQSTPGVSALNLRGLGPNRNLVLIDGRRGQPVNAGMYVDINSIPQSAVESVEVISGGASAAYGADAIAGVVNFKLKKNFEGLEVDAQHRFTEHGGGGETSVSALMGLNADRGNVMFGLDWTQRALILQKQRDFYLRGFNDPGTNAGGSYPFFPFAGFDWGQNASFVGLFAPNSPSAGALAAVFGPNFRLAPGTNAVNVNPNGTTLFYPVRSGDGQNTPGYTGPLQPDFKIVSRTGALGANNINGLPLQLPLDRYAVFGSAHYEVTDHITAYIQGNYTESQVSTSVLASPAVQFWGVAVPHDASHPVPAQLESLLASRPDPNAPWALQIQTDFLGPRRTRDTTDVYQVVAGLKGDVPGMDMTWDVYGSHGHTLAVSDLYSGFASTNKWRAFVTAPNYGANATLSLGSQQTAHCTSGFYSAIFQGGTPSQDCIDAVTAQMKTLTTLTQNVVEGTVQGGLFELPGGQLRFALGADYRDDKFVFSPDPLLDVHSISDAPIGLFPASPTAGFISVKEAYGELLVPVVKDMPFFKRLELDFGARYSDYSTAGGSWTWKATGNWDVNSWLSFRGGYQRAERAPNVAELFQPPTSFVVGAAAGDPCAVTTPVKWGNNAQNPNRAKTQDLCGALIHKFDPNFNWDAVKNNYTGLFPFFFPITIDLQQGNLDLKPEVSHSYTAGIVLRSPLQSPLLSRTSLSVDWYKISIFGAIAPLTSETLYEQCFNADGSSNPSLSLTGNPFCSYINREAITGGNRNANAPYFNLGQIVTSGVDVQLDWAAEFRDAGLDVPGRLSLNAVVNWVGKYTIQNIAGGATQNYAGTVLGPAGSQFRWKSFTTLTYGLQPWSVGMRWRHFDSAPNAQVVTNPATTLLGVKSHDEFDLFGTWAIRPKWELRAGVNNLFDKEPEVAGADTGATTRNNAQGITLSDYDVIGRQYFIGLKARF